MQNDLTFPASLDQHLEEVYTENGYVRRHSAAEIQVRVQELKSTLQTCYNLGITELKLETYGSGDCGEEANHYVTPDHLERELPEEDIEILDDYIYHLAKTLNPGYELNDGGGYECQITFYPFRIKGIRYQYVVTREDGETLVIE